jgi:elongation factor 1 alpha-like protein
MSKLQALAAARKKKAEGQKLENQRAQPPSTEMTSEAAKVPNKPITGVLAERLNGRLDAVAAKSLPIHTKARIHPTPDGTSQCPHIVTEQVSTSEPSGTEDAPSLEVLEPAAPSAFAQTLLGFPTSSSAPVPRNQHPIPYMSLTSSIADAFSEPSPDDVVITAQSKGSLLAKKVQA